MCSLVGMVMKVCGVKLLWSTPGCNSHSCQPLSCSATARQKDAEGSGRLKISLPYSRAKNPAKKAWSVWRIVTMGSLCCWRIMNRPLSGVGRIDARYYRFLGELVPALLPAVADWPRGKTLTKERGRWRLWQSRKLCRSAKLADAED